MLNWGLRIPVWIIANSALVGNLFVLMVISTSHFRSVSSACSFPISRGLLFCLALRIIQIYSKMKLGTNHDRSKLLNFSGLRFQNFLCAIWLLLIYASELICSCWRELMLTLSDHISTLRSTGKKVSCMHLFSYDIDCTMRFFSKINRYAK